MHALPYRQGAAAAGVERVETPAASGSPAAAAPPSELVEDIRWMARAACASHGDPVTPTRCAVGWRT
jgi:hypothetical protein